MRIGPCIECEVFSQHHNKHKIGKVRRVQYAESAQARALFHQLNLEASTRAALDERSMKRSISARLHV